MTEKQQYSCPLNDCNYAADNPRSVASHIQAKRDDTHRGQKGSDHWEDIEKQSVEGASSTESTDSSSAEAVEFPTAEGADEGASSTDESTPESTPDCCDDPTLRGPLPDGKAYRVDGKLMKLDQNEQICISCDTIHE